MSSPLQFYRSFKALLREHGIRAVLTSGMACVEYGIQQTTKDTDWIVEPADLHALADLFERQEAKHGWRISYRPLFGAPLTEAYLGHGWTSHFAVHDAPDSPEHHLDLFGQPPRVPLAEALADAPEGIASRLVVAQMKKTDRAKDWPFINGLAIQSLEDGDFRGLLHLRDPSLLKSYFAQLPSGQLARFTEQRPLLRHIADSGETDLERLLLVEVSIWQAVNRERYLVYQHVWKEFYRRWLAAEPGVWPSQEPFSAQHRRLVAAVARHGLPSSPLTAEPDRRAAYDRGIARARALMRASEEEVHATAPPFATIFP
ncbi:MAG: hypothetical protein KIT22_07405 [Verrucomicrobiae bacterium]|nr:hypothetical protein [Verrucomicrobiae bacterium]